MAGFEVKNACGQGYFFEGLAKAFFRMGYFGALVLERERMSCVERRLVLRVYIRYCTSYGEDGLVHRNNTNELVIVTECVFWSRF